MSRLQGLGSPGAHTALGIAPTGSLSAPKGGGVCPVHPGVPQSGWSSDLQAELLAKPSLTAEALETLVGKNAVFHLKLSSGRMGVAAGKLESVQVTSRGMELRFEKLDPKKAQALGGYLVLPRDGTLRLEEGTGIDGVASAHPLASLQGAPVLTTQTPGARVGTQAVMRRAREIRQDPRAIDAVDLNSLMEVLRLPAQTPQAHAVRDAAFGTLKTERYAATAVLIEAVTEQALARPDMQPEALADLVGRASDLRTGMKALEERIRDAFSEASKSLEASAASGGLPASVQAAWTYASRTLECFEEAGLPVGGGMFVSTPADNIRAGVNTVSDALPGLLAMTWSLGSEAPSGQAWARRFGGCRQVVQELAKTDLSMIGHVLGHLRGDHEDGMQPRHFPPELFEVSKGSKVELTDAVRDHLLEKFGGSMETPRTTTRGCPALIGTQGPNALVQLVNRLAETAGRLDPKSFGTKPLNKAEPTREPSPAFIEAVDETAERLEDRWPQLHLFACDSAAARQDFARRLCAAHPQSRRADPPDDVRTVGGWLLHLARTRDARTPVVVLDERHLQGLKTLTREHASVLDDAGLVVVAPEAVVKRLHPEQSQVFEYRAARKLPA